MRVKPAILYCVPAEGAPRIFPVDRMVREHCLLANATEPRYWLTIPRLVSGMGEKILVLVFFLGMAVPATAGEAVPLTLKDHKFTPAVIHVKADTPTWISLANRDSTAEEFDSTSLKVEKVVAGNSQGLMRLRALAPGRYPFMGEFHAETAQGVVIAQ